MLPVVFGNVARHFSSGCPWFFKMTGNENSAKTVTFAPRYAYLIYSINMDSGTHHLVGGGRFGSGLSPARLLQLDWDGSRNAYARVSDVWHGIDTQTC